jgi:hypothetical protein
VTTAGSANDLTVVGCNFASPVALRTYLARFRVDGGFAMATKILHFVFNTGLTLLLSISLPDSSRYLFCFIVLKFNDEFPLRKDGSLGHAQISKQDVQSVVSILSILTIYLSFFPMLGESGPRFGPKGFVTPSSPEIWKTFKSNLGQERLGGLPRRAGGQEFALPA